MKIFRAQMFTDEVKCLVISKHSDAKFLHIIYLSNILKSVFSEYFFIVELVLLLKQSSTSYTTASHLPRNTFPFLRLGMAPPAAPVAFCGKQEEKGLNWIKEPPHIKKKHPLMILFVKCCKMLLCFAVTEGPDGCHFVRNRC